MTAPTTDYMFIPYVGILSGTTTPSRLIANSIYSILTRLGYCVDVTDRLTGSEDYDLLITTSAHMLTDELGSRRKYLLFDADRFQSRTTRSESREEGTTTITLDGVTFELNGRILERKAAIPVVLSRDDKKVPISFRLNECTIEGLPLFLTPDIQRPEVFWQLGRFLADSIAILLDRTEFRYFEPWPASYRSALAITLDLDAMAKRDHRFGRLLEAGPNPCTLFACADQVEFLNRQTRRVEVACHGDIHQPFNDHGTNSTRVEKMYERFNLAGFQPVGFSPPNLIYTSPVQTLMTRFRYVRMGYMEKELLFYPRKSDGGILIPVSFYPDHALKYVAPGTFAAMTDAFLEWSWQFGGLAVLCFHPGLYPHAFERHLLRELNGVWTVTLEELGRWWNCRHQVMLHCRAGVRPDSREEQNVSSEIVDYRDRLDRLRRSAGLPPWHTSAATAQTHVSTSRIGEAIVVDNTLRPACRNVEVDVPSSSWILRFCPRWVIERIYKTGVSIDAKNGFHACFYGSLGLRATYEVNGTWRLRIPFLAANELLVIRTPKNWFRSHLRGTAARLRRLAALRNRPSINGISHGVAH